MPSFGAATNLVAGTITLTMSVATKYWYIQNQDTASLLITFASGSGFGPVALNAATAAGAAGDWMDSVAFPYIGTVTLSSTVSTSQFGSGATVAPPLNSFPTTGTLR